MDLEGSPTILVGSWKSVLPSMREVMLLKPGVWCRGSSSFQVGSLRSSLPRIR
jgi:hypothetical protein